MASETAKEAQRYLQQQQQTTSTGRPNQVPSASMQNQVPVQATPGHVTPPQTAATTATAAATMHQGLSAITIMGAYAF